MNYAYIRVSTESQTVENQRIVISDYAKKSGVRKLEWVADNEKLRDRQYVHKAEEKAG